MANSVVACQADNNFGSDFSRDWFTADTTNSISTVDALSLAANGYQPEAGSTLLGAGADPSAVDTFFDSVDYIGAMDESIDWTAGWVTVGLDD
jgi:hypothetical protein